MSFRDDGCYVHPTCLTCPLPACIYEYRTPKTAARDMEIAELRATGVAATEIAGQFAISRRSVFRILQGRA